MQSCWRKDRKPLIFIVFIESVAIVRYLNLRRFVKLAALSLRRGGVVQALASAAGVSAGGARIQPAGICPRCCLRAREALFFRLTAREHE